MWQLISNHSLEFCASLAGFINLWLLVKGRQLNWLFGAIMVSLYFVIFWQVKLYALMSLQFIFLTLQFYGWYQWHTAKKKQGIFSVQRLSLTQCLFILPFALIFYAGIGLFLKHFTNSTFIWIDTLITTLSLIAQWLMAKRYIEHWLIWMIVDILAISLYLKKMLYFTSLLYAIFFLFCIQGFKQWRKIEKQTAS